MTWKTEDEQDDRVQGLRNRAFQMIDRYDATHQQIAFNILQDQTNPLFLGTLPTAADGVGLFSTVDAAGNDRFGVTGGNILPGQTLSTVAGVEDAVMNGIERFTDLKDTEGFPYYNARDLERGFVLFGSPNRLREMLGATQLNQIAQFDTNAGASQGSLIQTHGAQIDVVATPYITTNDELYLIAKGRETPLVAQIRMAPYAQLAEDSNSDDARRNFLRYLIVNMRAGHGIQSHYAAVKLTT